MTAEQFVKKADRHFPSKRSTRYESNVVTRRRKHRSLRPRNLMRDLEKAGQHSDAVKQSYKRKSSDSLLTKTLLLDDEDLDKTIQQEGKYKLIEINLIF